MPAYLATDSVIDAVDELIAALNVEPDERVAFAEATDDFVDVLRRHVEEVGAPADTWPPLATMVALEVELLTPGDDRAADRAAAVATVRQALVARRAQRASLN